MSSAFCGLLFWSAVFALIVLGVFSLPRIIRRLKRREQIDRDILDTRLRDMQYQNTMRHGRR